MKQGRMKPNRTAVPFMCFIRFMTFIFMNPC